jgi:hypothetical protein
MIAYQSKTLIPRTGAGNVSSDPQGVENDGCGSSSGCPQGQASQPYNTPLWANFTLVGTGAGVVDATSGGYGMVLRRGTGGYYVNGVIARWPKAALSIRDASTTARATAGDFTVSNVLAAENGAVLHAGQQPWDLAANAIVSTNASAASLFNLLPTDPTSAAQFDWAPAPTAPQRTGGMAAFTGAVATKAGSFVTATSYRGAADPAGARWWQGWTIYADN